MQTFTGWQYLLIDLANQFGLDKEVFEKRIAWAESNLHCLEDLEDQAETQPLYMKAVRAIRKAQQGLPMGHVIGFDACCSGIQIMSAVTGCVAGATATGLVDPDVRADAYAKTTEVMNGILHAEGIVLDITRKQAKDALMTSFYGSKLKPQEIFGEDTPELSAFYQAAHIVAPGAWDLLQDLLASWQPYALVHSWKLPDGFDARVKVMQKTVPPVRIEVDELDHSTFSYEYYENIGSKKGLSNVANVVHSIDAYVLRGIHRRCNYNQAVVLQAHGALFSEADLREQGFTSQVDRTKDGSKLDYYLEQYERSGVADVVILPYLMDGHQTQYLSTKHIKQLLRITDVMLSYEAFEVITIHDEFKCHPNNMNHLRQQYIMILAELAESELMSDILTQIHGVPGVCPKLSHNLGDLIRNSNYALS